MKSPLVCPKNSLHKAAISSTRLGISQANPLTLLIWEETVYLAFLIKGIYCSNYILLMSLPLPNPCSCW